MEYNETFSEETSHDLDDQITKADENKEKNTVSTDKFTQLMFGNRVPKRLQHSLHQEEEQENKKEDVNYFTLMGQIDDIMVSLENLKPVLKELSPIMDFLKKKK
ncbi:hypothetical protein [Bacillus sp. AFS040349]|uniref:hypothetical protein n=1 Tax=Bacillus sp. AFS040349 TaxID=2033502 RepID=UPI000BFBD098|nr:hypothetical protein [Bacillus sp. AFS040349]PGT80713.1 hypothetical protein COD11_20425 [Bacillus sp. AFS040349]